MTKATPRKLGAGPRPMSLRPKVGRALPGPTRSLALARARARAGILCIMSKRDLRRLSQWSKLHSRPEKRSQGVLVVVFLQEDVGDRT